MLNGLRSPRRVPIENESAPAQAAPYKRYSIVYYGIRCPVAQGGRRLPRTVPVAAEPQASVSGYLKPKRLVNHLVGGHNAVIGHGIYRALSHEACFS
jgi:hypothetical protein